MCHDPDGDNFGVEADIGLRALLGSNAGSHGSSFGSNAQAVGLGHYKLDSTADPKWFGPNNSEVSDLVT
ncbi:hypothetical protein FHG66_06840 [Rubellimicrobium rubrum]|uniref:Uncharacterized protein n=1 Tax=Rubellimicrobium rubrum TaxID=2585369 RepID=A0A5C4MZU8_9RHOB|nr:hypothetical protein [Rubellimicrobium rubrum]TNC51248.1 hypothetical protein FHG66_06840 [Rubellimicrobium rubrum]